MLPERVRGHLTWNSSRFPTFLGMARGVRQTVAELGRGYNPSFAMLEQPTLESAHDDLDGDDVATIAPEEAARDELLAVARRGFYRKGKGKGKGSGSRFQPCGCAMCELW